MRRNSRSDMIIQAGMFSLKAPIDSSLEPKKIPSPLFLDAACANGLKPPRAPRQPAIKLEM